MDVAFLENNFVEKQPLSHIQTTGVAWFAESPLAELVSGKQKIEREIFIKGVFLNTSFLYRLKSGMGKSAASPDDAYRARGAVNTAPLLVGSKAGFYSVPNSLLTIAIFSCVPLVCGCSSPNTFSQIAKAFMYHSSALG